MASIFRNFGYAAISALATLASVADAAVIPHDQVAPIAQNGTAVEYCLALYPDFQTQLCTADRNLALFWVGIEASDMAPEGTGITSSFTPRPAILPEGYAERWAIDVAA